ncbi:MAG: hypothetical protein ACLR7D_06240 [Lachnospira eligens]
MLKLFLRLIREKEEVSTMPEDSVNPVTDDDVVKGDNDLAFTDNPVMSAVFTAFAMSSSAVALGSIYCHMIDLGTSLNLSKSRGDNNGDEQ